MLNSGFRIRLIDRAFSHTGWKIPELPKYDKLLLLTEP